MSSVEAPEIDTFEPVRAYRTLGLGFVTLRSEDGVRLDVSEAGAERIAADPDIAPLLARMGEFIAEHGGYRPVDEIKEAEPSSILRVGESMKDTRRYGYGTVRLSSVYRPDSAPGAIVKAYDYDRVSSGFQFYLGTWMHGRLATASNGLRSAAQLAMFSGVGSRLGHRTTVMEYVAGEDLFTLSSMMRSGQNYEWDEVERSVSSTRAAIIQKVRDITGWRGRLAANDLRNLKNIIAIDPEAVTLGNMPENEFVIIDQPVIRKLNLPAQLLARYAPHVGRSAAAPTTSEKLVAGQTPSL
jgi:hypothetical protein